MYNENIKRQFMSTLSESYANDFRLLFGRSEPFENELNHDIAWFSVEEIGNFFESGGLIEPQNLRTQLGMLATYGDWCLTIASTPHHFRDYHVEDFPYAIRVVSEVLSSNGSTSQGSICGSTLALMDAGVPIKAPVAGISCGLIQDDDGSFTTFIDIQGVEDFHGEMDFKVGGTKKGITAIQMDLKNDGLTMEIIKNALDITYDARCEILDQIMLPCIAEPRPEVSKWAPKMITMHIDPDNIRDVIGKGGSVIQKIVADTGAKIDIDDDGTIHIASADAASCDAAKAAIDAIVFVPEVGQLYYGRVVRLMQFGAFVELAPGKDGLVHISKLANKRVEKVEDVCKIGDMMWVKVTEIDEKGRVNLSHKDAVKEIEAKKAAGEPIK